MTTAVLSGARVHGATIRLTRDDLTLLPVDAFVYYASPDLKLGAGYGTAVTVRGGPTIQKELNELAPLRTCDVVRTAAGKLPAESILHAVGPRFREPELEAKLRRTMRNVLALADREGVRTLAFPAMGAGYYGVPAPLSARVMLEELAVHLAGESGIEEVVISVLDTPQQQAFEAELSGLSEGGAG